MRYYPVGTEYTDRHGRLCKVVDILKTYSMISDNCVKIRHVVEYEFCNQIVTDRDVVYTTITRRLMESKPSKYELGA
jgi:hypothetical protein